MDVESERGNFIKSEILLLLRGQLRWQAATLRFLLRL